jgi:hypothetical protein
VDLDLRKLRYFVAVSHTEMCCGEALAKTLRAQTIGGSLESAAAPRPVNNLTMPPVRLRGPIGAHAVVGYGLPSAHAAP